MFLLEQQDHKGHMIWDQAGNEDKISEVGTEIPNQMKGSDSREILCLNWWGIGIIVLFAFWMEGSG